MALTDDEIKVLETLVEHYGVIDDWQVNHWRNYHLMIEAVLDVIKIEQNSEARVYARNRRNDLNKSHKEEGQRLENESDKLFLIASNMYDRL